MGCVFFMKKPDDREPLYTVEQVLAMSETARAKFAAAEKNRSMLGRAANEWRNLLRYANRHMESAVVCSMARTMLESIQAVGVENIPGGKNFNAWTEAMLNAHRMAAPGMGRVAAVPLVAKMGQCGRVNGQYLNVMRPGELNAGRRPHMSVAAMG